MKNTLKKLRLLAKNLASPPGGSRKKPEQQMLETQVIYNRIMSLLKNCGDLQSLYDPGFTKKARLAYAEDKVETQKIIKSTQDKILALEMMPSEYGPPKCDELRKIITEGINSLDRIIIKGGFV